MSEHTPGPWVFDGEEGIKSGNRNIAAIYVASDYTWMDANELPFQAECIANAHLIAAAPKLLEVLEQLIDATSSYTSLAEERKRMPGIIEAARAAIAKARGV